MNKMSFKTMVAAISLVAIAPTSLSVLACNPDEGMVKTPLNDVITVREVEGTIANDVDTVLAELVVLNLSLNVDDVEIKDFIAATEIAPGSAKIIAKPDTKYTGEVDIVINSIPKLSLTDIITVREVDGKIANDEGNVLKEIVRLNPNLNVENVEIDNFKAATATAPGSAKIIAKPDAKYTGEVGITITSLEKTDLNQLIKVREVSGSAANDPETVLTKILELNKESDIVVQEVEIKDFIPATIVDGSAVIAAKSSSIKYTGEVSITIKGFEFDAEKKVVDEINSDKFSKSVNLNAKAIEVKDSANAKFIKDRLNAEIGKIFNDNLFTLNKIINDKGEELTDEDLVTVGEIAALINYNYGEFKNQDTQLIITVKQIDITEERNWLLGQIKDKSDNDEDDNEWSDLWISYFKTIEADISNFSFQFPKENLKQNNVLQNIVYDEVKLVMESDFKAWNIVKGYDSDSVIVTYDKFSINEENDELFAEGRLSIKIKSYGSWAKHSVLFKYNFKYFVI